MQQFNLGPTPEQRAAWKAEGARRRAEWPERIDRDRAGYCAQEVAKDRVRKVRLSVGGCLVTAGPPQLGAWYESGHVCGIRGRITGFSAGSRKRMQLLVAGLEADLLPILVTLTYPGVYSNDGTVWKRDLDTFAKALVRMYPGASMVWKLEPQQRGAPHFHGMVYGVEWINKEWLRETWFGIVGSGDVRHLAAGTRVERARTRKAAMAYMSKRYMGKLFKLPEEWENVGRIWGVINRAALPVASVLEVVCTREELLRFRRVIRRKMRGTYNPRMGQHTFHLFCGDPLQWGRLLMFVCGEVCPRADLGTRSALGGVDYFPARAGGTQGSPQADCTLL